MSDAQPGASKGRRGKDLGGVLVTAATLVAVELLARTPFALPDPAPLYFTAVVYAAVTAGIRSGLIATALTLAYAVYDLADPGRPFHYAPANLHRLVVLTLTIPAIALMVGFLRHRAGRILESAAADALLRAAIDQRVRVETSQWESRSKIREARLAAEHAVARVLAEAPALGDAAPVILRAVGESLGWEFGGLWIVDRAAQVIRCVEVWHVPEDAFPEFEALSRRTALPSGAGLPGRVWASGEPAWITDVVQDPNFPRLPVAAKEGLHAGVGFPVRMGRDVLGVIEFFSREIRPADEDLLQMMASIGSQIGQFVERKDAETALRESEARTRAILESALDCIITMDHEGRIVEFNPAAEATFGYQRREVIGKPLAEAIIPPALREEHRGGLARYLATGEGPVLGRRIEMPGMRADGSELPVELAITRIAWSGPPMFTAYLRDITERKRAEAERAELMTRERTARAEAEAARARFAFLAEASTVLNASLDYPTTLASLARLAVPHLGDWCAVDVVEADRTIRRMAVTHADPAKMDLARELQRRYPLDPHRSHPIVRVIQTGVPEMVPEVSEAELRAVSRDAEHLELLRQLGFRSYMAVPLVTRGRRLGAISFASMVPRRFGPAELALAEDLARRAASAVDNARLYREGEEANRAKDEFLATLSHELRTPLTAVLGWTQLLRSAQLDDAMRTRAIETIERNARTQAQLINGLLEISRIVTGKLSLEVRPLDLRSVIEAALETVRPAAEAKRVLLDAALPAWVGPVSGDPDRLQQVVWNLLSNAIKFTPAGGRVEVRLAQADGQAEIQVSDTGQGIRPEFLPFVFDRFRQADSTTTRSFGGLGLGLAIVRHLVELHGGRVEATSEGEGQGATFRVWLPLLAPTPSSPADPAGRTRPIGGPAGQAALGGVRVLLVDDEADARDLITMLLAQLGAEVTAVGGAAEAVQALDRAAFDVLVSDIGMPGEDGYALMRSIRARPPDHGGRIPAVALTAYARAEDRVRSRAVGFERHVAKPVDPEELIAAVVGVVGHAGREAAE
ncbi:MAG TPA: ATP-binding protein [Methylomirabilota bacterium]|nr:ATP-binding protein [Methylomirabilota bacterium]